MYNADMLITISKKVTELLRWSQQYTKTDMTYAINGAFWILLGKGGLILISLATMTAFARWLPMEIYGTYQFILAGFGIAGTFALSGINTSLVRSIAQNKEGTLRLVVKEKIRWALLGSFGLLLIALWYLLHQNFLLAGGFAIAAVFLPFRETFAIAPVFWNGKKRFDIESAYRIIPTVLALFVLLPVIYSTNNVLWILFVTLASHVVFDGFFLFKTIRQIKNKEEDKEAVSFGKNLTAMDAVVRIAGHIDKIILWKFLGPIQVAIYSFAQFPIKTVGGTLPIQALALPKLGERNIRDIKQGILRKFFLLFFLSVPLALSVIFAAPLVYGVLFPQYTESIIYLQALSFLLVLVPFNLLGTALISDLRKKELYVIRVGSSIFRIILFFVLVPLYGIWGVVCALLIAEMVRHGMTFYYFQKI